MAAVGGTEWSSACDQVSVSGGSVGARAHVPTSRLVTGWRGTGSGDWGGWAAGKNGKIRLAGLAADE